jgi:coenzyme PQQ synthesis protein D (PqqD)
VHDHPTAVHDVLRMRASISPEVVYREFPSETVLLNLATQTYHGLNPVGGRMLARLEQGGPIGAAVPALAAEFDQPPETVARDLAQLCRALHERGLIELHAAD